MWNGEGEPPDGIGDTEFLLGGYMGGPLAETVLTAAAEAAGDPAAVGRRRAVAPIVPDGVTLCNGRGVHGGSTAELAVAGMLALTRRLPHFLAEQAAQRWSRNPPTTSTASACWCSAPATSDGGSPPRSRCSARRRPSSRGPPATTSARIEELPELLPDADIVVDRAAADRRHARAGRRAVPRRAAGRRHRREHRPRPDRRHRRAAGRTAGRAAAAPSSTSPIPNRCRPSTRCGRRRT